MRLTLSVILAILTRSADGRYVKGIFNPISDSSDRSSGTLSSAQDLATVTVTCEPTYGFLPCTTELWGELFLIAVYECLLALAGKYVSSGSELFFRMFGTGIFGAFLFQMLGTFPQVIIMLASAITLSSDTIESMAAMAMAMLAGSAIFSLSIVWGSIVAFGSCDFSSSSSSSSDQEPTRKPFRLTGSGVETDLETKHVARIMFVSMIPFLVLQAAKIVNSAVGRRIVVLVSLAITVVFLVTYCTYQVFKPWIQKKRLEYLVRLYEGESLLQSLLTVHGKPNILRIKDLFQKMDQNKDSQVLKTELYAFMLGIQIEEAGLSTDDYTDTLMKLFNFSIEESISESEFVQGICKWLEEDLLPINSLAQARSSDSSRVSSINESSSTPEQESLLLSQYKTSKYTGRSAVWWNYAKAGFLIILGSGIMVLLAEPLGDSFEEFGRAAGIHPFFISYVLIPLAMSYQQGLAAVSSAKKKTTKDISGALTEVYNGVFMNNVMGLATFLALVCIKDMAWDVSAEALVVFLICSLMGVITSCCTKFQFWTCILAYALYPLSLLLLYILTSVLGWY
ncbi:sodium/calcium exchanger NCL2-like [Rhodamnia argentea]|uniref:Sodium/calcium exchanger NCL2-like n=1 Tax=Rhodamnia argentea TaxID=178133 RepID=A0ABM3H6N6_9MYRT|nr:sodium/calcium exchanger NCL2-like [Rhodamnia argentea]